MTFALIGDSQADGLSAPLARLLPVVFSEPHVGWTTARVFGEPLERALASRASVVIAVVGGNDDPLSSSGFLAGADKARRAGKRLIVVGPVFALTDDAARHDRARTALTVSAQRAGVPFVDAYPLTRDLARPMNVHLGDRYPQYAVRLATALAPRAGWMAGALALLGAALAWRWFA